MGISDQETAMLRELSWYWCRFQKEPTVTFEVCATNVMQAWKEYDTIADFKVDGNVVMWKPTRVADIRLFRLPRDMATLFPEFIELQELIRRDPKTAQITLRLMGGPLRFGVEEKHVR
jgi:hypothetical protein